MSAAPAAPKPAPRLEFIDNIRWLMIVLVVAQHAAVTYSGFGRWYFMEPTQLSLPTAVTFGLYESHTQAFFMGLLFFIAGYFAPGSFDRKGPKRFVLDRMFRLGVPSLVYIFVVEPFNDYALLGHRPWLPYFTHFRFLWGTGPMWFAVALLIFSSIYALLRVLRPASRKGQTMDAPLPTHRDMALLIVLISACAFLIRTVQPIGTAVLNMQLCYFAQYVILFIVGIEAYRRNWMTRIPWELAKPWFIAAPVVGIAIWFANTIFGGALTGKLDPYNGGWHWQSAVSSFEESFFSVAFSIGLLVWFRRRFNRQGAFARFMSDNAFAVYVFHPPVVIATAMFVLAAQHAPPLVKFVECTAIAATATFLLSAFALRRIPALRAML